MNLKQYISFLIFISFLGFIGCKKTDVKSYSKDSLKLELKTVNGKRVLTWDIVNTSDFKSYEIYASNDSNLDVTKSPTKLIGTITSFDKNTFGAKSFVIDSIASGASVAYYKVAAVLQDRKIASNTLRATNDILFANSKYSITNYYPKLGRVYFSNNQTSKTAYYDLATESFVTTNAFINMSQVTLGTNANGNPEFITNNGGGVSIYDANNLQLLHSYSYNNLSVYSNTLVKGKIYISGQDFLVSSYVINIYDESNNTLTNSYNTNNVYSNLLASNSQNRLYCIQNFGGFSLFDIDANGALTLQGSTTNIFTSSLPSINDNGTLMWPGSGLIFYNNSFAEVGSVSGTNSFITNVSYSQNNMYIAAGSNISQGSGVSVIDAQTFGEVDFIQFENTSQLTFFNLIPMFYNNNLYIITTVFNNINNSQTNLIIKQSF
jgi:hypothetical protein